MASKGRKPKKPALALPPPQPLSDDDSSALDDFCKGIHLDDDVSLTDWQDLHTCLDLTVPLFLSRDEAARGLEKTLSFCRTIRAKPGEPGERKPATCRITLSPNVSDGEILLLEGEGDRLGSRAGNLKVIIRVKSSS